MAENFENGQKEMSKNVFVEIELYLEYVIFEFYSIMLLIIFL